MSAVLHRAEQPLHVPRREETAAYQLPVECFIRQQDVTPVDVLRKARVTIIGAGAVGSFTALTLSKMGVGTLEVYDGDFVAPHNLPVQWYRPCDLGQSKVLALAGILESFGGGITAHSKFFGAQHVEGIVVSAVDSMDVRVRIWKAVRANRKVTCYIDARMGAEVGKILVVRPVDPCSVADYEKELYPSSEAYHAPCTARATVYCAAGLAAFIAAKVGKVILNRPYRSRLIVDFRNGILI
jgi:molybdopterin/thiamine biosynthesis adenylyltransferase